MDTELLQPNFNPTTMDDFLDDNSSTDFDFSFTSCTSAATDRTFPSSARTSLARTSLTLSFNESRLSTSLSFSSSSSSSTAATNLHLRPHRRSDPHWSAIKTATTLSSDGNLHLSHLKLLRHLGTGNLGRVFLCRLRDNDHANFALKVVDRDSLSSKKLSHVKTEAEILSMLDHPFLPTLYAHLEVSHYTCLLIDYCPNGDLHSLLRKQLENRLPIDAVRFYAAEVLVALEYLHSLGIVYRDLKPENILLREDGHIMLSDFDLGFKSDVQPRLENQRSCHRRRRRRRQNCLFPENREEELVITKFVAEPTTAYSRSCVGTHEYLAPELVTGVGHGSGVDWWAFGIFLYEMLHGTTPFKGGSKEATLRNIASNRGVMFRPDDELRNMGLGEARDLIERLLVKDPKKRMGCTMGATDIKAHPFFKDVKWPLIRMYKPPEVRGITLSSTKKSKSQKMISNGPMIKRTRLLLKGLSYLVRKTKGSKHNLTNSNNYYRCSRNI